MLIRFWFAVWIYTLKSIVKLLHPFIPFITEEIYQTLPHEAESITIASWPKVNEEFTDLNALNSINDLIEIITSVRNERAKANKAPKDPIDITILAKDENTKNMIEATTPYLVKFTNPKNLEIISEAKEFGDSVMVVLPMATLFIPTSDLVDMELAIKQLQDKKAKLEGELARSNKMLSNQAFVAKAPAAKIEAEKAKQANYQAQYDEVCEALAKLVK